MCYGCSTNIPENQTIIAVPVYGQSLALGEEAKLITNFDTLSEKYDHRILTEDLDESFGFYSESLFKQKLKKILCDHKRTFEISCYGMGEYLIQQWKKNPAKYNNYLLCTFAEGSGSTAISELSKGSSSYDKLLKELQIAYELAQKRHCKFIVPAFCWMQGENDLVWGTGKDYGKKLIQFRSDFNNDIKKITHQKEKVKCILYQTSCLSIAQDTFKMNRYNCPQTMVPEAQMELVRDNNDFSASNPSYPYSITREYVHLNGESQKAIGYKEGVALMELFDNKKNKGLTPKRFDINNNTITISFNIPCPPLEFDTISVRKIDNYGFSVIMPNNKNILSKVILKNDKIYLICSESPLKAKVRYAVNGIYWKSGNRNGPRGNLRDSQGDTMKCIINRNLVRLDDWCYIFDISATSLSKQGSPNCILQNVPTQ